MTFKPGLVDEKNLNYIIDISLNSGFYVNLFKNNLFHSSDTKRTMITSHPTRMSNNDDWLVTMVVAKYRNEVY